MTKRIGTACGAGALMLASIVAAQEIKMRTAETDVLHFADPPPGLPPGAQTFEFISSEMGVAGKVVKGAPYSAEAVTETTHRLADGNRISRKNSTTLYRDAEGRTRREVTLSGIGPWASSADTPAKMVFIHDPVAGVSYSLNEKDKTARKMEGNAMVVAFSSTARAGVPAAGERNVMFERKIGADRIVGAGKSAMVEGVRVPAPEAKNAKTESLGKRNIEGVEAEGTRTTWTIPAGEIGNELPIEIVSERWYSPELQTVVMTRQADPRIGETVYKLASVRRGNPAPQMFEVPSDYTVITEEAPKILRKLRSTEK
jgi:hypothetical protein